MKTYKTKQYDRRNIDRIRKNIRSFMKFRKELALKPRVPSLKDKILTRIAPYITLTLIGFTIWYGVKFGFFSSGIPLFYIFDFIFVVSVFFWRLQLSRPPKGGDDEVERWIWKKNLKTNIYAFLILIGLTLFYGFLYDNSVTRLILILNIVVLVIVALSLSLVFLNPSLFLNSFINSIGTLGIVAFIILYLLRLVFTHQYFWLFVGAGVFIPFLRSWWVTRKDQELTLFQMMVLQSIDINKLFNSLRSLAAKNDDETFAREIWRKEEKKLTYGQREEFLRLIASVYNKETNKIQKAILNILSGLLLLFLTTIIGLLIEDLFYAPIIKPYLCQFTLLQNFLTCN